MRIFMRIPHCQVCSCIAKALFQASICIFQINLFIFTKTVISSQCVLHLLGYKLFFSIMCKIVLPYWWLGIQRRNDTYYNNSHILICELQIWIYTTIIVLHLMLRKAVKFFWHHDPMKRKHKCYCVDAVCKNSKHSPNGNI